MPIESATFVNDLVTSNPPGTDQESQGANHLRLLKTVLQATFPGAAKAFPIPTMVGKSANYSVQKADFNTTFVATTSGGAFTFTLPTLVAGDAGWECEFIKIGSDTNPYFIAPPSGTLQSGEISALSKTRRCIPGHKTKAFWTGSVWLCSRVLTVPVGSLIPYTGLAAKSLPIGYEWPNGQTLASVATNYPDYNAVFATGVVIDLRGRFELNRDDMGGSAAGRVTAAGGNSQNFDGTVVNQAGGRQEYQVGANDLPVHTHALTDTHFHATQDGAIGGATYVLDANSVGKAASGSTSPQFPTGNLFATRSLQTGTTQGSLSVGNNTTTATKIPMIPPSLVCDRLLVVE